MSFPRFITVLIPIVILGCSSNQPVKKNKTTKSILEGCIAAPAKRKVSALPKDFFKRYVHIDDLAVSSLEESDSKDRRQKYNTVLKAYEDAINSCVDCSGFSLSILSHKMAIVATQHEDYEAAITYMDKSLQYPKDGPLSRDRHMAFSLAVALFQQERYSESKDKFKHWESLCPTRVLPDYYLIRSHISYFLGDKGEALEYLNRGSVLVKKSRREDGRWHKLRVELLNALGQVDEAEIISSELYPEKKTMLTLLPVSPEYPAGAALNNLTGQCDVTFTLAETGRVRMIEELDCSNPVFSNSVKKAVMGAWVVPYVENGKRVEVQGQKQRFSFNIE